MEPRRVADFPPALQRADSMRESAYGSMTKSNAGDASIGQPNLYQIGVSNVPLGPVDPPGALDGYKSLAELNTLSEHELCEYSAMVKQRAEEAQKRVDTTWQKLRDMFHALTASQGSLVSHLMTAYRGGAIWPSNGPKRGYLLVDVLDILVKTDPFTRTSPGCPGMIL
ncbi:uncharacterized protein EI90DRAFT_3133806 [Cantharellus anzutake]|uniref:uncharacterized protein n=1 Tax=Cantharellus anzutake TaxID=1750568 RepID=UPI00190782F7|nr:uncharacterized protein EI90DRAFT_3133806 [Cantharellus anzutake]KAF8317539.1 hypothetical protein EI90DRAFT_3133806 [Cantharellus anzutake]